MADTRRTTGYAPLFRFLLVHSLPHTLTHTHTCTTGDVCLQMYTLWRSLLPLHTHTHTHSARCFTTFTLFLRLVFSRFGRGCLYCRLLLSFPVLVYLTVLYNVRP